MTNVLTQAKNLTKPTVGGNNDEWGVILNNTIDRIDQALGGTVVKLLSGDTKLTNTDVQNLGYHFTGQLPASAQIIFPSYYGLAVVHNDTNHTLYCGVAGGAFTYIAPAQTEIIWSDGNDFTKLSYNIYSDTDVMGVSKPWRVPSYTVANLPNVMANIEAGALAFATNARNPNETGNGSGCLVCRNNVGVWLAVWSGQPPTV